MKLAVVSDIHGNLASLEATLRDMERQGADSIVCLGDVASFGPQPRETLSRLRATGCPVVMGNTDASLLRPRNLADVAKPDAETPTIIDIEAWCAARLEPQDLAYIQTFEKNLGFQLGGLSILCFHGSPRSYDDVIVATTPDERLAEVFSDEARLMLGGHTHAQLLRRYREVTFVNPGSAGLPYEYRLGSADAVNPHWSEYALVEAVDGQPSITFRRVPYDVRPLIEAVRDSNMPHQELWLRGWLR